MDSNGDGIGDLQGVIQKLDYLHDLGFEAIWCSPFFSSPQADFGYDISDYKNIAPEYGTMDDALQLIEEVHKRGMRIVFDMVMNHTSDQNAWFLESRSSRNNPKADWYIWRDKPNNWNSLTGGSGWRYAPERKQYYWSSFLNFQPDLNYRNPQVKQTMLDIVRFWLSKGADGFRLDIFNAIYKDKDFRDNPFTLKLIPAENDPSGFFQEAKYNLNLTESFEFAKELRQTTEEFGEKILLGEVSGSRQLIRRYLGDAVNDGLGLVFDFAMLNFKFNAACFRQLLADMEAAYPDPFMPVYVFSNHDRRRSADKLGGDVRKEKLLALFQLTARGVPCVYSGEEIGMTNLALPFSSALDPLPRKFRFIPRFFFDWLGMTINRDDVRSPMQWDASKNGGFSSAEKTWLPLHPNYAEINVQNELQNEQSLLNAFKALLKFRKANPAITQGSLELIPDLPADVLGYRRVYNGETFSVFLNFSDQPRDVKTEFREIALRLTPHDDGSGSALRLSPFGGIIVSP